MTDTTNQGVSTGLSEREAILENAAKARREMLKGEGVEIPVEGPVLEDDNKELSEGSDNGEEGADNDNPQIVEPEVVAEPPTVDEPESKMFTVKIDGEEKQVTADELIKHYQKGTSAEKRFEEAAAVRKANEELERMLAEREAAIQAKENTSRSQEKDEEDIKEIETLFEGLTDAVLTDDKEKGIEIIRRLRSTPAPATPEVKIAQPEVDIDAKVDLSIARARYKEQLETAQVKFSEEFGDLDKNPILRNSVNQEASRIFEELPANQKSQDPWIVLKQAGDNVRKAVGAIAPNPNKEIIDKKKAGASKTAPARTPSVKAEFAKEPAPAPNRQQDTASIVAERNAKLT